MLSLKTQYIISKPRQKNMVLKTGPKQWSVYGPHVSEYGQHFDSWEDAVSFAVKDAFIL